MGDAYTAIADDGHTLFYNVAALGRNGMAGIGMYPLNPSIGLTNVVTDFLNGTMDKYTSFPDDTGEMAQQIMGLPIYVHVGGAPTLKFGPFAISLFYNLHTNLMMQNATHPTFDINYHQDRGFAMGYAHSFGTGGIRLKDGTRTTGYRTSIGATVKKMNRQALVNEFPLFGPELYNAVLGGGELTELRENLGYSKGETWGWDLGAQYVVSSNWFELSFGAAALDIGDTQFKVTSGTEVPDQKMVTSLGVAWKQDFTAFDYTVSFDMHPLLQPMSLLRRMHVGLELGFPLLKLFGGYNGGYLSYGGQVRLWPITIMAGIYGVEVGSTFREKEGSRLIIYLSLLDFSFQG